jgi:inorganic pyrophosphatase
MAHRNVTSSYSVHRPGISIQQVKHFFEHHKDLENEKRVKVTHWGGVEDAHRLILERRARAEK